MNGPVRLVIGCAIVLCAGNAAYAQISLQPTPAPAVTAETQHWYQDGEPLRFAGNVYYPAGAQLHFNGDEMVLSGFYNGVPLYSKTTIEPFSIVFVPVRGGLVQPYERRRTGDIAGTTGSSAPSFPVGNPGEPAAAPVPQAPMPPTVGSTALFDYAAGAPSYTLVPREPGRVYAATPAVAMPGRAVPTPTPILKPAARSGQAKGGVFIEFDNARWFSSGPATLFDARRFTRVGELHGLPVYTTGGRAGTIFVPVAEGVDLVAPYSKRGG